MAQIRPGDLCPWHVSGLQGSSRNSRPLRRVAHSHARSPQSEWPFQPRNAPDLRYRRRAFRKRRFDSTENLSRAPAPRAPRIELRLKRCLESRPHQYSWKEIFPAARAREPTSRGPVSQVRCRLDWSPRACLVRQVLRRADRQESPGRRHCRERRQRNSATASGLRPAE